MAWFLSWFRLVPVVAETCCPRNPSRWLGSCLGSTWFQWLQQPVGPEIQAGGLVPVLAPLGSRGCRNMLPQKSKQAGSVLSWFYLVPEVAETWSLRNPSGQHGICLGSVWFRRLQQHGVPELQASASQCHAGRLVSDCLRHFKGWQLAVRCACRVEIHRAVLSLAKKKSESLIMLSPCLAERRPSTSSQ